MSCDANEKGLGKGPRLLKRGKTIMCGLLEHGQKPHDDVLSNGWHVQSVQQQLSAVTKRFLALWMFRHAV